MDYQLKMNRIYKLSNLFDGDYDYLKQELSFSRTRHYFNNFIRYSSYLFFLNHLLIFVFNYDYLKQNLVSFRLSESIGERVINFAASFTVLSFGLIIGAYQQFHKNPKKLKVLRFLFCFDLEVMRKEFYLNREFASGQVKFQKLFLSFAKLWHKFYFILLNLFFLKLAFENLSKHQSGAIVLLIKLILFVMLTLCFQSGAIRVFIVFAQLNLSSLYFSHFLKTLILKIKRNLLDEQKLMRIIGEYSLILKNQRVTNQHFQQCFYFFFAFNSFTIFYPALILFLNFKNDFFLILFDLANCLSIVFLIFLPVICFNTLFTRQNYRFIRQCYLVSKHTKNVQFRIKLMNLFTLNLDPHAISFNFYNYMNYSQHLFIFVSI